MIAAAIGRIISVSLSFLVAVLAGALTLAVLGARWAADEAVSYTPDYADEVSYAINEWLGVVAFFLTVTPLLTLLPVLVAVVLGEVAKVRSLLYYVFACGVAAVVMPLMSAPPDIASSSSYSAEYFAIIATAGFAGGFIYWLLAGRNA